MADCYFVRTFFLTLCIFLTISCGGMLQSDGPGEVSSIGNIGDAEPRHLLRSRYGNPESYEVLGRRYYTLKTSQGFKERGIASWYGKKFHGRKTSSGETYDMYQMTAAHKRLPLPTYVQVTNLENGSTAILKVNDRGPFHENRVIDLSYAAAFKLGIVRQGTAFVEITAINEDPSVFEASVGSKLAEEIDLVDLYIQVGAFNDRINAQRMSQRVAQYVSTDVRIYESKKGNKAIHRVQIGPLASTEVADQLIDILFGLGIDEHYFVVN
ncbi:MAG TPA: septal ring lytic transglycosylase RlpA family lipoprotein [Gammaproteobacteria bacterium]|nr:septal ring lytic transglycosylase RlpA family lipoprotein [Gammaproteobacteria bacterium]|tara:strand:- start:721 stop:1524 length:804 start_codon:yes stop_codon:yes gene_type:complete